MKRRSALQCLAAMPLLAQVPATQADELADDIDILRETLLGLHPGLLRYNTATQIDERLATFARDFVGAGDLAQRYLLLSRLLATLRCGHSHANAYNQSRSVAAALFDRKTRLPFTFRWLEGQMVVTGDASGRAALPRGTVVTAVNGVAATHLLQSLLPYARADGHNDAKRRELLQVQGRQRLEAFDVFHGLVHGEPEGGVFKLALRLPKGQDRTLELPALTMSERHALLPPAPPSGAPSWQWRLTPQGVAVLHMPSWAVYDARWNWKIWLEERLDSLPGSKGLVVDLRGNEGGLDCGNPIIERFARAESRLEAQRLVRYRQTPAHLNRYLDTWDDRFRDWGEGALRVDERYLRLPDVADARLLPRGKRLDVPLVVLIDASNSSATFNFAQRVKAAGIGTLVGETTGGNQRGINAGAIFFVRLPASGLAFDLPLIGIFPAAPMPDAGLAPDHAVAFSADDVTREHDPQMARALALLATTT